MQARFTASLGAWTADALAVVADSCDRLAAKCSNDLLGYEFGRLGLALRENPVSYEKIRAFLESGEIARRRAEADIDEEVNREARLIVFGLRQLFMRNDADGGELHSWPIPRSEPLSPSPKPSPPVAPSSDAEKLETSVAEVTSAHGSSVDEIRRLFAGSARPLPANPTKIINAIAEVPEGLGLDLSSGRRNLAARLDDSIDQISIQNNLLMRSLSDYTSELRSYRDWSNKY